MVVRPLLLPDTASTAGYDNLDPISQWFLAGSGTCGAEATGIIDDDRYGLDLQNAGSGGQSLRATSGDNSYQLRVDNSGITMVGGIGVTGTSTFYSPVVMNSTLSVTGAVTLGSTLTVTGAVTLQSTLNVTGAVVFSGNATVAGTLTVGGLAMSGDLHVPGELTVDGNVTLGTDNADRVVVPAQATFEDDVIVGDGVNDRLLVRGGTNGLQLSYDNSTSTGVFTLGATNAADPNLLVRDNSGDTVATFFASGSTYQFEVTGDLHVTDDAYVDGDLSGGKVLAGTTTANGTEELRVVGQSRFEGDVLITTGTFRHENTGNARIEADSTGVGFFGATPIARPTVTGSRGGNAALTDLLSELANLGLITDSTS